MEETKVMFDLSKVEYEEIDGTKHKAEDKVKGFRNLIANYCYYGTSNLGLRVFSIELFKSSKVEVNRDQLISLKEAVSKMELLNPILLSFNKLLDDCLTQCDKADAERK